MKKWCEDDRDRKRELAEYKKKIRDELQFKFLGGHSCFDVVICNKQKDLECNEK